jgi:hypothetical protein
MLLGLEEFNEKYFHIIHNIEASGAVPALQVWCSFLATHDAAVYCQ